MQTSQSDHVYISPTALPIIVYTNVVLFNLYFTIYQQHCCIITIYMNLCDMYSLKMAAKNGQNM